MTEPILARLAVSHYREPLIDWHDELHDRFALPAALSRDLRLVLGDLDEHGLGVPAQLRSETPAGVVQEMYALSLGHFVIRSLMFEAAATVNLDPDRLSFTGCFQILKCRLPECDGTSPARTSQPISPIE